jgi:hypothetical protein
MNTFSLWEKDRMRGYVEEANNGPTTAALKYGVDRNQREALR